MSETAYKIVTPHPPGRYIADVPGDGKPLPNGGKRMTAEEAAHRHWRKLARLGWVVITDPPDKAAVRPGLDARKEKLRKAVAAQRAARAAAEAGEKEPESEETPKEPEAPKAPEPPKETPKSAPKAGPKAGPKAQKGAK